MSMTDGEIVIDVSTRWSSESLGLYGKGVGWYIVQMQKQYNIIFTDYLENLGMVSRSMLWILAYNWALLRWQEDLPGSRPAHWFPPPSGEQPDSPLPKSGELDDYPLEISGVVWASLPKEEYIMMVSSYIHDLSHAWQDDTTTLWSAESTNAARYLFEVCKQYLTYYGIAEGTPW